MVLKLQMKLAIDILALLRHATCPTVTLVFFLQQRIDQLTRKLLIYIEHYSLCPLVGIGIPPTLLPQASVPPPHRTKGWGGGGHTPLRLGGWGVPIPMTGEKA